MNDQLDMTERLHDLIVNRHFGKFRGIVKNNNDPDNRGRLKVSVPGLLPEIEIWAMPCMPFGGKGMGIFMIPDNETGVWVEFEGGNPSKPIWTGCYWTDDESPKDNKTQEPKVRLIRSEKGLTISLDDQDEIITISDKNSRNIITIDVNTNQIKIKAATTIVVEAGSVNLGGQEAIQPVVRGFELVAYLAQLSTAFIPNGVVPIPVLQPTMLSNKVKTV